jgi:hypothetical protein
MKVQKLTILFSLTIAFMISAHTAFGQVKFIDLAPGKKVVLKGRVHRGDVLTYAFTAKSGQQLTVRLISTNKKAVLDIGAIFNIQGDVIVSDSIESGTVSWSGRIPEFDTRQFGVSVSTPRGTAVFSLEITLR